SSLPSVSSNITMARSKLKSKLRGCCPFLYPQRKSSVAYGEEAALSSVTPSAYQESTGHTPRPARTDWMESTREGTSRAESRMETQSMMSGLNFTRSGYMRDEPYSWQVRTAIEMENSLDPLILTAIEKEASGLVADEKEEEAKEGEECEKEESTVEMDDDEISMKTALEESFHSRDEEESIPYPDEMMVTAREASFDCGEEGIESKEISIEWKETLGDCEKEKEEVEDDKKSMVTIEAALSKREEAMKNESIPYPEQSPMATEREASLVTSEDSIVRDKESMGLMELQYPEQNKSLTMAERGVMETREQSIQPKELPYHEDAENRRVNLGEGSHEEAASPDEKSTAGGLLKHIDPILKDEKSATVPGKATTTVPLGAFPAPHVAQRKKSGEKKEDVVHAPLGARPSLITRWERLTDEDRAIVAELRRVRSEMRLTKADGWPTLELDKKGREIVEDAQHLAPFFY
ncbi:hypothetical protein PFISCL1PPCAC_151, partial [Pristionchus fissidentatus]